jgi:hypothetical protein
MIKISAKPSWEWQGSKSTAVVTRFAPVSIRQTILPRSLDC